MNKEERRLYNQQNYNKRKEWYKQWNKNHYQQNKEKIDKRHNLYKKSDKGKSVHIICGWKRQGILCFDYDLLYSYYIKQTTCEFCDKTFTSSRDRHMDHDHSINDRFNVRGVLCCSCNVRDVLKNEELN